MQDNLLCSEAAQALPAAIAAADAANARYRAAELVGRWRKKPAAAGGGHRRSSSARGGGSAITQVAAAAAAATASDDDGDAAAAAAAAAGDGSDDDDDTDKEVAEEQQDGSSLSQHRQQQQQPQQQQHAYPPGSSKQPTQPCSTTQQLLHLLSHSSSNSSSSRGAGSAYYTRKLLSVWSEVCGSNQLRVLFGSFGLLQQHLEANPAAAAGDGSSNYSINMRRRTMSSLLSLTEMPAVQAEVPANVLQAVQQQAAAAKQRYTRSTAYPRSKKQRQR
jgi:hypothetical protein